MLAVFDLDGALLAGSMVTLVCRGAARRVCPEGPPGVGPPAAWRRWRRISTPAVVTAPPALLAPALSGPLDQLIEVLGTTPKRRAGGWIADIHCRHRRKRQALAEAGHGAH